MYNQDMKNPIIYILLNGELKMSPGKAAAQAVHAAMMLNGNSKQDFMSNYRRTVIVLEAKDAMQLQNLYIYLNNSDVMDVNYYIDEGSNEVAPYSATALAAFVGDNEELRQIFEAFPLYNGSVRVDRVDDRWGTFHESVMIPHGLEIGSKSAFREIKRSL